MRRMLLLIALLFLVACAGCSTTIRPLEHKSWSAQTGTVYVGTDKADVINACGEPDQSYKTKTGFDAIEYQQAVRMEYPFKVDIDAQQKFIVEFRDDKVARWYFEYWSVPKLVSTMKAPAYGN